MTRLALVPRRERSRGSSRYELLVKIASGATATVYVARQTGTPGAGAGREAQAPAGLGFSRLVAVKRAHPHLVDDPVARRTLLEEARLASRIHHANVASVHDVDETEDDLLLVMDYVEGASLAELLEASLGRGEPIPATVAVKIALDTCAGLSAVHELCDDDGRPLGLVHRDVSPQNVLVGVDGTARITDFGLARLAPSTNASHTTGAVQGKIAYVPPEYVDGAPFDVRSEVFALGVVIWEALANRRLFRGANEADTLRRVLSAPAPPLSQVMPELGTHLDAVIAKALEKQPSERHASVRAFGDAIERAARRHELIGTSSEVGAWVRACVGESLDQRRTLLRASVATGSGAGDASFGDTISMVHGAALPAEDDGAGARREGAAVVDDDDSTFGGRRHDEELTLSLHGDFPRLPLAEPETEPLREPAPPRAPEPLREPDLERTDAAALGAAIAPAAPTRRPPSRAPFAVLAGATLATGAVLALWMNLRASPSTAPPTAASAEEPLATPSESPAPPPSSVASAPPEPLASVPAASSARTADATPALATTALAAEVAPSSPKKPATTSPPPAPVPLTAAAAPPSPPAAVPEGILPAKGPPPNPYKRRR